MEADRFARRSVTIVVAIAAATVLTACGGGGGGTSAPPPAPNPPPAPPPPTGGVDRGGIAIGTITGFGSIFVNGVEYETDQAQITVDDNPGVESDLEVGHVVSITGTVSDDGLGDAETVIFENDIEGPVQSVDTAASRLVVAGQTVIVDSTTVFDDVIAPASLDGLQADDFVQISGYFDADGRLTATRIGREGSATQIEIKGVLASLDSVAMTFTIGSLTVNYGSATLENFGAAGPADGDFVEARGDALDPAGELIATAVEAENVDFDLGDGDGFEIEGFITSFVSVAEFAVNGQAVNTNAQTVYENGSATDLGENVKVEVEGEIDANDVRVATSIEFKLASNLRVSAPMEAVDPEAGLVTVLGLLVRLGDTTQFEDESVAEVTFFGLDDLAVGDFVEVRGYADEQQGADIVATRLERDDAEGEVELRGFVESVDTTARSLVILGITIITDAAQADLDGFFDVVAIGDLVEVEGQSLGGGVIDADELEFENVEDNDGMDDGDDDDAGDDTAVSGPITAIVSAAEFVVGSQVVVTNEDTEFENGSAADLAIGVDVRVEGTLDTDNVLVASKVDFDTD